MKKTTLAVLLSLAIAGPALALSGSPVTKVFTADERNAEMTITNTSKNDKTFQFIAVLLEAGPDGKVPEYKYWNERCEPAVLARRKLMERVNKAKVYTQDDKKQMEEYNKVLQTYCAVMLYHETDTAVFVPSVAKVGAGKSQTARFIRKNTKAGEQHYRVIVRELPNPEAKGIERLDAFDGAWVWRPAGLAPNVSAKWQMKTVVAQDGKSKQVQTLVVTNTGNASAHLTSLIAGNKKVDKVGWVVAGETKEFVLPNFPRADISLNVNGKTVQLAIK